MSLDHTAFEADFMSGEPVVVKLKPKPPRTMEELAISPPSKLPGKGAPGTNTVYIGLVIINNKQIRSQPSNIVNISLALKDGGLSPNDGSSPSNPGLPGGDLLKYAAITVGVVTLLACVVGLLCYCGAKRNARGNTGRVPAGAPIGASTAPLAGPPQHPGTTTTQLTSTATH
ncbi:uncharacterized protein LOC144153240 [Haemaphysalis longicornis]